MTTSAPVFPADDPHPLDPAAEIHPLLRGRWSTRLYDARHTLADDDLRRLFEAARWAPSAGNSQPWSFVVGRRGDPTHAALVGLLSRGNAGWAPAASALVLTLHRTAYDEEGGTYSDYAQHDLGQAVAHLDVQARSMDLFVHHFAGFDHDGARAAFAVPEHWAVTTCLAIGRRAEVDPGGDLGDDVPASLLERERSPRSRNPLSASVFAGRFGTPYEP